MKRPEQIFITVLSSVILLAAAAIAAETICSEAGLAEHPGAVTQKGKPVVLLGHEVKAGDDAPDFTVVDNDMKPVDFRAAYKGKIVVISSVYSLDTPVCDLETRKFNEEASKLGDIVILTISMDLPMMQKRWCGAHAVDKVVTLSDYRYTSFGAAYGMLIKGQRMLARGVFVMERTGKIRYADRMKDIANEPDYAAVMAAAKKLL